MKVKEESENAGLKLNIQRGQAPDPVPSSSPTAHPTTPHPPWVPAAQKGRGEAVVRLLSFWKVLGLPWLSGTRLLPAPPPGYPRGRSALPRGWWRRSPRGDLRDCQLNWLLQKWKPKMAMGKDKNLQAKQCKQKGREEQRENRRKRPTKRLKKTYLQKIERLKMVSGVAEEKEAKLD